MTTTHAAAPASQATTGRRSGFQIPQSAAERYERVVGAFMLALSADLVERARPRAGERVVDLACGTGFVTRLAAARVGARGTVVGVDVNPAMVAEARRVTGLDIVEASADATDLPPDCCDLVLCQQGLQYVPDPAAVLEEARRILRPGGRLAMSVWSGFDANPFRSGQLAAMTPYLPASAIEAFRGTDVSAVGGVDGFAGHLVAAGLGDVVVEEVGRDVELPPMRDYFPVLMSATPWSARFEALTAAQRLAVVDHLEAIAPPTPTGCRVRMTVAVATATKPTG